MDGTGGMDLEAFKESLKSHHPPEDLPLALQALWWVANGEWDKAHRSAQAQNNIDGAWVHAHLHRVEGDESNADYWYRRAGKLHSHAALGEERDEIISALLASLPKNSYTKGHR